MLQREIWSMRRIYRAPNEKAPPLLSGTVHSFSVWAVLFHFPSSFNAGFWDRTGGVPRQKHEA
jgi:hypothetical protein